MSNVSVEIEFVEPEQVDILYSRKNHEAICSRICIDGVDYSRELVMAVSIEHKKIKLIIHTSTPDQIGKRVTE